MTWYGQCCFCQEDWLVATAKTVWIDGRTYRLILSNYCPEHWLMLIPRPPSTQRRAEEFLEALNVRPRQQSQN